eukprot:TRINITY_DN28911_c0_g2_i1.p1 TRINITY_DN28911_c0_g2~~TRINITY_DN28911_c0_g2_i1.p1  ORF type:complete len:708 (+),score=127.57 TRINITY_DN28911_c0_g2_i1:104-2227(+)
MAARRYANLDEEADEDDDRGASDRRPELGERQALATSERDHAGALDASSADLATSTTPERGVVVAGRVSPAGEGMRRRGGSDQPWRATGEGTPPREAEIANLSDSDVVLTLIARLQRENVELRRETQRLQGVADENSELQQVVTKLKGVVASYGFTELELMNVKPKAGKEGLEQLRYAPREMFIIISMKFAEIAAYYGGAYIYTNFMSEELGMTDQEAGNLYAAYGFISTFLGLGAGIVIDKLGVRKSLLIGTIASTIARFAHVLMTSKFAACFISLTFFPLGGAFGVPVLALGIRRYSHRDNRKFAFSIFYTMLMLATLVGTMMINQIRGFFPEGTSIRGQSLSWMRITWLLCTIFTLYTVVCAFFLRDIQVCEDQPLEDMVIQPTKPPTGSTKEVLRQIGKSPRFWRLTAVSLIFCGVQMGFRHLDATFPKYMMRTYGPNAPWEVILSVNPIVTFFCAPVCTAILIKYKVGFRKALILGAFLTGFSPFIFAFVENYLGMVLWIVVMSLGQAIWGPKLYEYSTMSAPTGREGLFVAITAAPIYLSSVPAGLISGWLLENYCPKNARPEDMQGGLLWLYVGFSVAWTPVLLWILRKKLLKKGEDKPPDQPSGHATIIGNRELALDEESRLPEVPTASLEDHVPVWGTSGAAWAGMGGSLSDDDDDDFAEAPAAAKASESDRERDNPQKFRNTVAPDLLGDAASPTAA